MICGWLRPFRISRLGWLAFEMFTGIVTVSGVGNSSERGDFRILVQRTVVAACGKVTVFQCLVCA
jgi:hypothetical protein